MEIWIIRDGEKAGPFQDYEIRRRISNRDLSEETPAWHEGLDAWKPLVEISLFKDEFENKSPAPAEDVSEFEPKLGPQPPPMPVKTVYIRRFFARWFDLILFSAIWWLTLWACGRNIGDALTNPLVAFIQYIPWFVIEAILLHKFGTTPGKWLLGLRVANIDESLLSLSAAIRRSLRVLLAGIGMGWPWLTFFCQGLSLFIAKRFGNALWDFAGGHRVYSKALAPFRIITLVILFFGAMQLQVMVIYPYLLEIYGDQYPELKAQWEKDRPWHLPVRGSD